MYSPADDAPIRIEFFDDELDTMGFFDALTQRRTQNIDQVLLLPLSETPPRLHPDGLAGLSEEIGQLIAKPQPRQKPRPAARRCGNEGRREERGERGMMRGGERREERGERGMIR